MAASHKRGMRLVSWNVNGLRAVVARNDLAWAFTGDLDVICLQETKIQEDALTPQMRAPAGYRSFWSIGKKKGYSGTAVFVKDGLPAERVPFLVGGSAHPEYDDEGRVVALDLGAATLVNVYFPNGGNPDRLQFKHDWHDAFLDKLVELAQRTPVILTGDFNIAHRPIDLALPERWQHFSGFLPKERAWFDRLLQAGFIDTFRAEKGDVAKVYTFWETRVDARKDNLGWRIDYFLVSRDLEDKLLDAWTSPQVMGSDHCPVGVELELEVQGAATVDDEQWQIEPSDTEDDDAGWRR